jgi:hypothetical protein
VTRAFVFPVGGGRTVKNSRSTCSVYRLSRKTPRLACPGAWRTPAGLDDVRSGPLLAAKRGRAMRTCPYRMATVWPHSDKQVTLLGAPHSSLATTRTGPTHFACRSSSRYRLHCARRMRMFCPIRLSRTGRHGTRWMPMPSSIMAKRSFLRRPDTAVIRTGGAASVHETLSPRMEPSRTWWDWQ